MPADLRAEMHMSRAMVVRKLYHEKGANTFLASQAGVIFKHAHEPYVRNMVRSIFDRFVEEEILVYDNVKGLSVNFVGSIAFLFQKVLAEALKGKGLTLGTVIQKPIDRLTDYHFSTLS